MTNVDKRLVCLTCTEDLSLRTEPFQQESTHLGHLVIVADVFVWAPGTVLRPAPRPAFFPMPMGRGTKVDPDASMEAHYDAEVDDAGWRTEGRG